MKVCDLCEKLDLKILCGEAPLYNEVKGCYCGDLLSWVMSRAKSGDAWLTVMGNVNSIGVAVLADIACIILVENAPLDSDALKKAKENGIAVLQSSGPAYDIAVSISKLLGD
jgi:predicted transcriptional regulator